MRISEIPSWVWPYLDRIACDDEIPNRRPHIAEDVGDFTVTVSMDPRRFSRGEIVPCEMFYSRRAKSGTDLEQIQYDVGTTASKLMQGEF